MHTFAQQYRLLYDTLMKSPAVYFSCRSLPMWKEMSPAHVRIEMKSDTVSVFSCKTHRVLPIKFALAELCYILAERNDVESIAAYNHTMGRYSEDGGKTVSGAYGDRLRGQLNAMVNRLLEDEYTRQSCGVIYKSIDTIDRRITHIPCNVFLQFLYRQPYLALHLTSRSSDFVTGFPIDALHWQFLLVLMKNELNGYGKTVLAKEVYYTLASLHVYECDRAMIEAWEFDDLPYESFLTTKYTLRQVMLNCRNHFKAGLSLDELCELLGLDQASVDTAKYLHGLFKEHRNVLVR